ncbi:MAG: NAD-dependent epimerase/dehydratase family protein, partial [Cellulomonadaceae bacterium]|nr:NAD-dependent epimerase/dehydratase family protein [Cellulomonadaceae bacterium]
MGAAKSILFIGGTGAISHASVARAVALGHNVTVLNRGSAPLRPMPEGIEYLKADANDHDSIRRAIGERGFDVVTQFRAFSPEHVGKDIELFRDKTGQYVFISTASAFQKPLLHHPITESTPLVNPYWKYSRDKIAAERLLTDEMRNGFPVTIVRPSHTYDSTLIPTTGGWTDVARFREGKPVIVHGDGTTQWTLTHTNDFAVGFVGLLGNPLAVGDSFNIVGDYAPDWNSIYTYLAQAAGVDSPELVHVASETIARVDPEIGAGLLGDKAYSAVFDNSKIKALVPEFGTTIRYDQAAHDQVAFYDAHPEQQHRDANWD